MNTRTIAQKPFVIKFGGTSVGTASAMSEALSIIEQYAPHPVVVIASACSGITDSLIELTKLATAGEHAAVQESLQKIEQRHYAIIADLFAESSALLQVCKQKIEYYFAKLQQAVEGIALLGECSPKMYSTVLSFGELLSTTILAEFCHKQGLQARWLDSRTVITTDSTFPEGNVLFPLTRQKALEYIVSNNVAITIMPGFIAADTHGKTTLLGRGGSDYSAALIGAAIGAAEVHIWKEVSGILSADPRIIPNAIPVPMLPFEAMEELALYGVKAVHTEAVRPAVEYGIAVRIKNTFHPEHEGTLVCKSEECTLGNIPVISMRKQCLYLYADGTEQQQQLQQYISDARSVGAVVLAHHITPKREYILLGATPASEFIPCLLPPAQVTRVAVICCAGMLHKKIDIFSRIEQALTQILNKAIWKMNDFTLLIVVEEEAATLALTSIHEKMLP